MVEFSQKQARLLDIFSVACCIEDKKVDCLHIIGVENENRNHSHCLTARYSHVCKEYVLPNNALWLQRRCYQLPC